MSDLSATKLETILVVEADESVLGFVVSVLENVNFVVIQAKTGAGAVELAANYAGKIDLLLANVQIDGMSGPELADVIKRSRPATHAMFIASCVGEQMLVLNYGWAFIERPFVASKLVEMINDILHSPDRSQGSHQYDRRIEIRQRISAGTKPRRPIKTWGPRPKDKITKTKEQGQLEIVTACRHSGLDGFSIAQIMADFYGWQKVVITSAPGITEHTITNAWSQSNAQIHSSVN